MSADARLLIIAGYAPILIIGTPFGVWHKFDASEVFTWTLLNEYLCVIAGLLLAYTVLRLTSRHAGEDSPQLAARLGTLTGRPMRPEAFRKQVSRARRVFAGLLVKVVAQTLDDPSPVRVEEELSAVDLLKYVRPFLPEDWATRSTLGGLS